MFGSRLILPTGTGAGAGAGAGTRIRTGGVGGLSSMGSSIPYHPTTIIMSMSFPSSSSSSLKLLPRTRIRASADTLPRVELFSKPTNDTTLNLYQILCIKQNASSLEIKTAYRKLAKQFHPDALPPTTTSSQQSSSDGDGGGGARDFMAIHNAYATLSDPTERARYDLSIQIQTTSSSSSSSHTRRFHSTYYSSSSSAVDGNENNNRSYGGRMQTRRWETDQCW